MIDIDYFEFLQYGFDRFAFHTEEMDGCYEESKLGCPIVQALYAQMMGWA